MKWPGTERIKDEINIFIKYNNKILFPVHPKPTDTLGWRLHEEQLKKLLQNFQVQYLIISLPAITLDDKMGRQQIMTGTIATSL